MQEQPSVRRDSLATKYFHKLKTSENNRITDCVSYLLEFKGTEYVDSLLDNTVSDDVLKTLVYYLSPNSENLLRLLEERNEKSESGYEFFYHLLKIGSDVGFSSFIMGLEADIDSLRQKFGRFMDIGREIEEISDFKFLPYLERLFPLACAENFPTNEFLSLGTCVCRAFCNLMAKDFQIVESSLHKLLQQHETDLHLTKILYRLLQELDFYRRKQLDIPLSEKEALEIIDKIKKLR